MSGSSTASVVQPHAPLGHLSRLGSALAAAQHVDDVATSLLTDLAALPGVTRIGFALTEGGGRRLRFTASDRAAVGDAVSWCHIDAYDDVPLTSVVRTGEPVLGACGVLEARFSAFVSRQPDDVRSLAAVPVPGADGPIGGFVLYLDEEWSFDASQRDLLQATARWVGDAVRRVRAAGQLPEAGSSTADGDRSARTVVDADPRAAGAARRFVRGFLERAAVAEDVISTAELCVSELVTNAIVHAGTRSEVRAALGDELTVSVRDHGRQQTSAPDGDADPLRVHGRGLQLVEVLADRWGSERDADGTTVWFALDLRDERGPRD